MAEKYQRGALGKARRERLRATIGLLRDRVIAPDPRQIPSLGCGWHSLVSQRRFSKPHTATEMDLRLCEFVQHAWEEGDSRNIPADARSSLLHFIEIPRGQLHGSQRLLRAWSKNELPM